MMVLFLGGVESTAGLIATTLKLLADHPDQRELAPCGPLAHPGRRRRGRPLEHPAPARRPDAARDVTLHGVDHPGGRSRRARLRCGEPRRPRQFDDADRYLVTRGRFRHLGFGEGMHGCLGRPARPARDPDRPRGGAPGARPVRAGRVAREVPQHPEHARAGGTCRCPSHRRAGAVSPARPSSRLTGETMTEAVVESKETVSDGVVALTLRPSVGWRPSRRGSPARTSTSSCPGVRTRQYSLSGDPADCSTYRLGRAARAAEPGHVGVRPREPASRRRRCGSWGRATTSGSSTSARYVFVAGGIGITPILPMVREAQARGADWHLTYGGRSRSSMAFLDELAQLRGPRHRRAAGRGRAARPRERSSGRRGRTPASTAAARARSWTPSRRRARLAARQRCTPSASRRGRSPSRCGPAPSRSSCAPAGAR